MGTKHLFFNEKSLLSMHNSEKNEINYLHLDLFRLENDKYAVATFATENPEVTGHKLDSENYLGKSKEWICSIKPSKVIEILGKNKEDVQRDVNDEQIYKWLIEHNNRL